MFSQGGILIDIISSVNIDKLKPHSSNETYYAPMEGEEFNRLKESIRELDILTPLRVSADMTIISGHQRYRAAKELGFKFLPVIVDEETISEDEKKLKLIASNFQRIKHDPVRQARWIAEYERLRGVRHGGDRKSRGRNVAMVTQADIFVYVMFKNS